MLEAPFGRYGRLPSVATGSHLHFVRILTAEGGTWFGESLGDGWLPSVASVATGSHLHFVRILTAEGGTWLGESLGDGCHFLCQGRVFRQGGLELRARRTES